VAERVGVAEDVGVQLGVQVGMVGVGVRWYWVARTNGAAVTNTCSAGRVGVHVAGTPLWPLVGDVWSIPVLGTWAVGIRVGTAGRTMLQAATPTARTAARATDTQILFVAIAGVL